MKKFLSLILLIVIIFSANLQIDAAELSDNLLKSYNKLETDFYKGSFLLENIEEKLKNFITDLDQIKDSYPKFYYQGKSTFILGEIEDFQNNKEKAVTYYEEAQKAAEKAMEYKETSDVYNLAGKIYIRLLNKKGAFYAIRNGQKTFDLINKAVELDENNYSAYNSLGIIYLQAPKIGGGDITKSEKFFEKALKSDKKIDNFISNYYLSKVYKKKDKQKLLENFREKAKNIFPDSYYLKNN